MNKLFKPRISAATIGPMLFDIIVCGGQETIIKLPERFPFKTDEQKRTIQIEVACLDIFAVDYAAFNVLGESKQKCEILDNFYDRLSAVAATEQKWQQVQFILGSRFLQYTEALKAEPPPSMSGPYWNIGRVFASACNQEIDVETIFQAGKEYHSIVMMTVKSLRSFKIT